MDHEDHCMVRLVRVKSRIVPSKKASSKLELCVVILLANLYVTANKMQIKNLIKYVFDLILALPFIGYICHLKLKTHTFVINRLT